MMEFLEKTRRYLWLFVELGFLAVLSVILVYLLLGDGSGVFVKSVADNVMKFANGVQPSSLIGIGVLLAIIYLLVQRIR
jgi:uncharacterized membrane protein